MLDFFRSFLPLENPLGFGAGDYLATFAPLTLFKTADPSLTGGAIEEVFEKVKGKNGRLAGYVSAKVTIDARANFRPAWKRRSARALAAPQGRTSIATGPVFRDTRTRRTYGSRSRFYSCPACATARNK